MDRNSVTGRNGGTKWSMMLIGASCLLGVELSASPSSACLGCSGPPPTAWWQVVTANPCTTDSPGPWEVFIFSDKDGGGKCRVLTPGLYPDWSHMGLPDNWMSSYKVGEYVRGTIFKDSVYRGSLELITKQPPPEYHNNGFQNLPDGWNETISSMRVELSAHPCWKLRADEIALFSGPDPTKNFPDPTKSFDDCIVLPVFAGDGLTPNKFPSSMYMGIADNSISTIDLTKSKCDLRASSDSDYGGSHFTFRAGQVVNTLHHLHGSISSIELCP
jgi:hypothetical protein